MHLHTVYMAYSECMLTLLNSLAERTLFLLGAMDYYRPAFCALIEY